MKCLAEIVRCGDTVTVKPDGSLYDYYNAGELTILGHRAHENGDYYCVEVEHPGRPEEVVLVRAGSINWNTLRGKQRTVPRSLLGENLDGTLAD